MISVKTVTRILVWSFIGLCIAASIFLYFFGDINRLKGAVEANLKNQLTCTVKLGNLEWDWDGLKLGVTTSEISLFDSENNLVLQGGPTRFVWHLKNIINGTYSHFYSIESTDLYLNAIRDKILEIKGDIKLKDAQITESLCSKMQMDKSEILKQVKARYKIPVSSFFQRS